MSVDQKNFQREIPKRLHPYSKYKLSVKALPNYSVTKRVRPEEKYLDAETSQGFNMNLIEHCLLTDVLREKEAWRLPHFSYYQVFLCILH